MRACVQTHKKRNLSLLYTQLGLEIGEYIIYRNF